MVRKQDERGKRGCIMRKTGVYQKLGDLEFFIPSPLPPVPALVWDEELSCIYGEALFALGKLNEVGQKLPDIERFIKAYVIKEALLSSAIEGIHTTLIDVFTAPLDDIKLNKDTQLVLNYTRAATAALDLMQQTGLPLTNRVLLHAHVILMGGGVGDKASPGSFRKQSVRVGPLVPPPATAIGELMGQLEHYINVADDMPPLIKAGLAHVQFETIHPFLDGNGRIGRLLIILMFVQDGLMTLPILYPSYYFKKHHATYYYLLDRVRTHGDWEGWIKFYLSVIKDSAQDAYQRISSIEVLENQIKQVLVTNQDFKRVQSSAELVLKALFNSPVATISYISNQVDRSYNTVHHILKLFQNQGWVTPVVRQVRNKLYHFTPYLELLERVQDI